MLCCWLVPCLPTRHKQSVRLLFFHACTYPSPSVLSIFPVLLLSCDLCVGEQMPSKYSTGDAHMHGNGNGTMLQSYSATAALLDRPPTLGGGGALQFYGSSPNPSPHVGRSNSSPPQQPSGAYGRAVSPAREQSVGRTITSGPTHVGTAYTVLSEVAPRGLSSPILLPGSSGTSNVRASPTKMNGGDMIVKSAASGQGGQGGAAGQMLMGKWELEDKDTQRLAFKVNKEYTSFLEDEIKKLNEQVRVQLCAAPLIVLARKAYVEKCRVHQMVITTTY
jgi:hypothetical protein